MKILFFCTAHNSLSQRLYLVLSRQHSVTVEYALTAQSMIEAAALVQPDLIICPFLTSLVPQQIYDEYLTLIVHPGPPGDAGPSAIDWLLMGDDGTEPDSETLLAENRFNPVGRSHWGVTVLQATGEFDAGPVWAFDQFAVDINGTGVTKSSLYRGPVTRAAIAATLAAVERIEAAATLAFTAFGAPFGAPLSPPITPTEERHGSPAVVSISPGLSSSGEFAELSVTASEPFLGGRTHHRPLLKAAQRDFDVKKHDAEAISRRIRSADSQPGCLSGLFGPNLYLYGGMIEDPTLLPSMSQFFPPGSVVAIRDEAVCIATCDDKGVWITHIRQVKSKTDPALWPKVPAASGLQQLGLVPSGSEPWDHSLLPLTLSDEWSRSGYDTFQEIWVDFANVGDKHLAYLYFDFYNGAMSTKQCNRLVQCLEYIISRSSERLPLTAVVLMGGDSYFSNGIHLNVIEAAANPAEESWYNINAIDDVVQKVLLDLPSRGITTVAAIRGNAAAGGVALATACDVVLAGPDVVLNPAYRALGLYGSEFHSISYPGRCGPYRARTILRSMTPLSANDACDMGLVDYVLPKPTESLDTAIRAHVEGMFTPGKQSREAAVSAFGSWKESVDTSSAGLAQARAMELGQMSQDFWSPRSERYHTRRRDFVRKSKPSSTPLRFASHRRQKGMVDEEERDEFDSIEWFQDRSRRNFKKDISEKMIRLITDFTKGDAKDGTMSRTKLASPVRKTATMPSPSTPVFSCYYNP
ncbi:RNA polymerase II C-terminal domain kinase beta subunit [Conoideocrella luteorostrata]|uniref:RNA polymerase II C-terminal domain kinase beta subunit n=1 Tax=Conoideocrella luteorostrata TaxID=1105319 RepID=A0AAJ0CGR6_9HYPO|nr:RNA polymerase II C-terminal domain kinase beta subunit [Conoideocrella luteorostrata]